MPSELALLIFLVFIAWLLFRDVRCRKDVSAGVWLAVLWLAIIASRPISAWLDLGATGSSWGDEDGHAMDRNVYLFLMGAALLVLGKRRLDWHAVIARNRPLIFLYLFCAISIAWSDYSLIALKRWLKDFGNILMILVIITEKDPVEAARAAFVRCACLLIPLSVLFIKYYPRFGKEYDEWTGAPHYVGVTLGKNMLGATVFVLMLFLIWELIRDLKNRHEAGGRMNLVGTTLVMFMAVYVLRLAHSATALACVALGAVALLTITTDRVRQRLREVLALSAVGLLLLFLLSSAMDLEAKVTHLLGRDTTLTGRDKIWKLVLAEKTDFLVGTGFNSFWLGDRSERLSEKNQYMFLLNEAHNGYLEMYLNEGAIGVGLLLGTLFLAGRKILRGMLVDPQWSGFRLTALVLVVIYNWSEAAFFRMSPVWFLLLLAIIEAPRGARSTADLLSTNELSTESVLPAPEEAVSGTGECLTRGWKVQNASPAAAPLQC